MDAQPELAARVAAVFARYLAQNGLTVPEGRSARFGSGLAELVGRRGLPGPGCEGSSEPTGGWREEELGPLVAELVEADDPAAVAEAARQLVKACFYPELKACRDSFQAVGPDGLCRRQDLARVRTRVSGSHCVDCPHWVALRADEHARLLGAAWRGDAAEWQSSRELFLPEDFRALRRCLHALARVRE
jgi:hypothetical protein